MGQTLELDPGGVPLEDAPLKPQLPPEEQGPSPEEPKGSDK